MEQSRESQSSDGTTTLLRHDCVQHGRRLRYVLRRRRGRKPFIAHNDDDDDDAGFYDRQLDTAAAAAAAAGRGGHWPAAFRPLSMFCCRIRRA